MENQDVNNSDGKSSYAPTTNFPPTRAGTWPPNANPFGTIQRAPAVVSPRESGIVRSPALKLGILSGMGGGLVLRPSLLSAGNNKEVPSSNGSTSPSNSSEATAEDSNPLEQTNGDTKSVSSPSSTSEVFPTEASIPDAMKEKDTATETTVQIESPSPPDDDAKVNEQVETDIQSPPVKAEEAKSNDTYVPSFVFGSNLGDRVENAPTFTFGSTTSTTTPATSELTFATASTASPSPATTSSTDDDWKKYAEERSVKRKWEDTTPTPSATGEEEESNVLQTTCRLFTFDNIKSSWVERGRGLLRLNDRRGEDSLSSRLIIRAQGTLRVMLNTAVFHGMLTSRASEKSIKITALDEGEVKVYLIQCSPSDAETLHTALQWRVRNLAPPSSPAENFTIQSSHFQVSPTNDKKKKTE